MAIDIEQIQQIRSRTLEALRALEGSVWREVQGELHAQYREIPTWILLYEDSDLDGKEIKPGDKWDMGHKPGYENIMTQPSEENRELARYIISIFGGRPGVREYFDDQKVATIDILTCTDAGQRGVNAYSTLALSDIEAFNADGVKLPFGVELIAACEADATQFVNVISTCAFNIIKDKMPIYPDAVFLNAIKMYKDLSSTLLHAMIIDPFLLERSFDTMQLKTKKVCFLQVIGISESEYVFLHHNGADALLDIFVDKEIDVYDINRPAVV